jgi:hypothetical protein
MQHNLIEWKAFYKGASGSHLMTRVYDHGHGAQLLWKGQPPINIPCRTKPEYPEETHDFR